MGRAAAFLLVAIPIHCGCKRKRGLIPMPLKVASQRAPDPTREHAESWSRCTIWCVHAGALLLSGEPKEWGSKQIMGR